MAHMVMVERVLMSTTSTTIERFAVGIIYRERVDPQKVGIVRRAGDGDDDEDNYCMREFARLWGEARGCPGKEKWGFEACRQPGTGTRTSLIADHTMRGCSEARSDEIQHRDRDLNGRSGNKGC